MVQQIIDVHDARLKKVSKEVVSIDKKVQRLILDLKETLKVQNDPEGIGLAAPQIGKNVRIFVMKDGKTVLSVINPVILSRKRDKEVADKTKKIMEGCLSLPNYYGPIQRSTYVKVKFLDENGAEKTKEFEGLEAQIVEHEVDHLNGVLFINRLLEQKQPLYEYKKNGDWERVEIV